MKLYWMDGQGNNVTSISLASWRNECRTFHVVEYRGRHQVLVRTGIDRSDSPADKAFAECSAVD